MSTDALWDINGISPNVRMTDDMVLDVGSNTSKSTYKIKRTTNHYHCTCPAWRNQKTPVDARTCKHLKALLGEVYEDARVQWVLGGAGSVAAAAVGAGAKGKPTSKRAAANDPEDDEENSKPATKKPKLGVSPIREMDEDADADVKMAEAEADEEVTDEPEPEAPDADADADELACINGIKPTILFADGEERSVKSMSSSAVYKVKRTWDHFFWYKGPVNARTCKHLQELFGAQYEYERVMWKNPDGDVPKIKVEEDDDESAPPSSKKQIPDLLLANKYDPASTDPAGWWISEKLDGVRTYFDGTTFWSRLGNPFTPPSWFIKDLPKDITLDGELFGGRGQFQSTVSIVKTVNSPHWQNITFEIFDTPSHGDLPFETRIKTLQTIFGSSDTEGTHQCAHVKVVEHVAARDHAHVLERLKEVEELGGEGVMLREPDSKYQGSRSNTLLKVKTFYDAEAVVTGYAPGKGRNAGTTGALMCRMESGKTFNVGTGLSDKQRRNPPKVGSIIVYRFQELTRDKVPRFPSFVGEAADKTVPKDADIPPHRLV
ncbi:DNA ligase/mRNA capping enzyme [Coprinopsis marcescibilis]|uniref:DNA ligase/mRNA capping enzyme n=1 Tax=Coprinopsis marcescibilis TaxID=230819 RepID=A0A5C3KK69_COPMA|nr:DNA ligase/mRNA capping enzyme [Coprinopsis marcescibilis]